ncbi:MAG: hypothetical protein GY864_12620 [Desulfobacterales bacterium]|nr:hypothetical protein [Desulfobacterales bacterium]
MEKYYCRGKLSRIKGASIYGEKGDKCAKLSGTFTLFRPGNVKSMGKWMMGLWKNFKELLGMSKGCNT